MLRGLTAEKDRPIEREAQRLSGPRGQLSWIDWTDTQAELLFARLNTFEVSCAFESESNVSGNVKPGIQAQI